MLYTYILFVIIEEIILIDLLAGVGVDADYRDLIDKNYLMVKHAMENQHIDDTIKDYCNGIVFTSESKLSQGQFDGKNSKVAILSDFQTVELKDKLEKRNSTHSDDDGISDGEELGTEVERDITPFVIKCNNNSRVGLFSKAREWKEFNEGITYTGTGDSDVIIKAKMWNYKSNPVLNDTDFDGLDDNTEHNKNPLNNDFSGSTMTVDSDNYVLDLDFNQDFRYFLWNSDTKGNPVGQLHKTIDYYSRDTKMNASYISPIEPYIYDKTGNLSFGDDLTKVICGNKEKCKIVSMRLYDERCAEDDGTPIEGTWEKRQEEIQKNTEKKLIEVRKDKYNSIEEYFNDFDNKRKFEKVVNY